VRDKKGKTHALKSVNKAQIVQLGQQEHIMSEKRVMAQLDHPFLVRLNATFKDQNFLYFLLEPSLGGELFSVLRQKTFFDEETARFYAAAIVLAFEYMHTKGTANALVHARGVRGLLTPATPPSLLCAPLSVR
jgi:serine/threonine protein kinase